MTVFGPLFTAPITRVSAAGQYKNTDICVMVLLPNHLWFTTQPSALVVVKPYVKQQETAHTQKKPSCSIYGRVSSIVTLPTSQLYSFTVFFWTTCKSIYRHRWDLLKSHIPHLSMFSWRFSQFFTWFPSAWKKNIAREIAREIHHFSGKGLSSSRKQRNSTQIFNEFCL